MAAIGLSIWSNNRSIADNMGLLAVGLPVGLAIRRILGARMDKETLAQGIQLSF